MEAGEVVADVAVGLLNGEGNVLACVKLFFGYKPVVIAQPSEHDAD